MIQFDEHIFQMGWNHQLEHVFLFHALGEFEFLIQLRVSTLGSVRWGVVLGCDGGDRLEQSLGCGTDGKSLRLSDGQIGYWSTGGQNADNMVVEIIFPRKNGNPPLFWILCFFVGKRLDGTPWNLRDTPFNVVFLDFYWDAEINWRILNRFFRWNFGWVLVMKTSLMIQKPFSHRKPGTRSTKKQFLCFNWVMFVSLAELLE